MFNDLFHLSKGEKYSLSRKRIIKKMEQVDKLRVLSIEYNTIKDSKAFQEVNEIRNNFVHNKSSSYYGMNIERHKEGVYVSHNAKGLSTKKIYHAICELITNYQQLCVVVNNFIQHNILDIK